MKRSYKRAGEGLLERVYSDRTRDNSFKMNKSRLRLDTRKKSVIVRVMRCWNILLRKAPFLKEFQARLDGALSSKYPMAGGLKLDGL